MSQTACSGRLWIRSWTTSNVVGIWQRLLCAMIYFGWSGCLEKEVEYCKWFESMSQSVSQSSSQTLQKPKSGFYNSWRVLLQARPQTLPADQQHNGIVWKSTIQKKYGLAEFAVRCKKPLAGQLWQNLAAVLGLELSHNHSLTELFSEWICVTDWLLVAVSQPFDLTAVAALNWTGAKPRQPPCQLQHMSIKLRTCSYKWTAHWLQTLHQFGHWLNILRETRQH